MTVTVFVCSTFTNTLLQNEFTSYDMSISRLHGRNSCFQTGYVQNNMIQWVGTDNGPCGDGPPKGRTWFKFQVGIDWLTSYESSIAKV